MQVRILSRRYSWSRSPYTRRGETRCRGADAAAGADDYDYFFHVERSISVRVYDGGMSPTLNRLQEWNLSQATSVVFGQSPFSCSRARRLE